MSNPHQDISDELWKSWLGRERAQAFSQTSMGLSIQDATTWNRSISGAMWMDISIVEVALRNKIEAQLQSRISAVGIEESWLADPTGEITKAGGQVAIGRISEAAANARRYKKSATHSDIIAELSLGFWKAFFTKPFQAFHSDLVSTFDGLEHRNFQVPANLVSRFHRLRNRLAHHHRMIHRDLNRDWLMVIDLARALDLNLEQFLLQTSSCPALIAEFSQIVQAEYLPSPDELR